ncbi:hypothetical protein BGZ54_007504 [Gamsiella multidivaricata]|nr:hypothetical protein BGZ54_007504 [Gamsiella multidivaricata]
MEDDFPFSFGNVSDQDEGSDGLFCALKTKGNGKRTKAPVDQEPYYAQIDEDGWFHRTGKSVRELMLHDKNGATKVKMQADHCYMLHKYQDAYDIAQEYCYIIARNDLGAATESREVQSPKTCADKTGVLKVTDSKEMQEMALRCAVKLGKFVEAEALADDLEAKDIVYPGIDQHFASSTFDARV